jgi:hypothetical protein
MKRFKSFYGPDPTTIVPLFKDLRDKYPSFKYKEGLITLNWLFLGVPARLARAGVDE